MNAIPTKYAGVQFRSRLEARWAAMFDMLGWIWEYEPIDLAGYIPDFIVREADDPSLLIEVKPITAWPCPVFGCRDCGEGDRSEHDDAFAKIRASGWEKDALLVGATVGDRIGHKLTRLFEYPLRARLGRCEQCGTAHLADDIIHVSCQGHELLSRLSPVSLWREAGNRVQWRAPR